MDAIVHIGMPKTGTSSIQHFLGENEAALAEQGVYYRRRFPNRLSQFELPMSAFERIDRHLTSKDGWTRYAVGEREQQTALCLPTMAALREIPSKTAAERAIFSSEHIFAWIQDYAVAKSFHEMMLEVFASVRYVVYVRDPAQLVPSRYSEGIKRGKTDSLADVVDSTGPFKAVLKRLEWWSWLCGAENFKVRLLDPTFLVEQDLLTDFCAATEIDITRLQRPPRVNESLSAVGAEALRRLNFHIPQVKPDGAFNGDRNGFLPTIISRTKHLEGIRLTEEQNNAIKTKTAAAMEQLRTTYFPDRTTLFNSVYKPPSQSQHDIVEQSLALMAELLAEEQQKTSHANLPKDALKRAYRRLGKPGWVLGSSVYYRLKGRNGRWL